MKVMMWANGDACEILTEEEFETTYVKEKVQEIKEDSDNFEEFLAEEYHFNLTGLFNANRKEILNKFELWVEDYAKEMLENREGWFCQEVEV